MRWEGQPAIWRAGGRAPSPACRRWPCADRSCVSPLPRTCRAPPSFRCRDPRRVPPAASPSRTRAAIILPTGAKRMRKKSVESASEPSSTGVPGATATARTTSSPPGPAVDARRAATGRALGEDIDLAQGPVDRKCRGRESNPHDPQGSRDFKSRASTSFATSAWRCRVRPATRPRRPAARLRSAPDQTVTATGARPPRKDENGRSFTAKPSGSPVRGAPGRDDGRLSPPTGVAAVAPTAPVVKRAPVTATLPSSAPRCRATPTPGAR